MLQADMYRRGHQAQELLMAIASGRRAASAPSEDSRRSASKGSPSFSPSPVSRKASKRTAYRPCRPASLLFRVRRKSKRKGELCSSSARNAGEKRSEEHTSEL